MITFLADNPAYPAALESSDSQLERVAICRKKVDRAYWVLLSSIILDIRCGVVKASQADLSEIFERPKVISEILTRMTCFQPEDRIYGSISSLSHFSQGRQNHENRIACAYSMILSRHDSVFLIPVGFYGGAACSEAENFCRHSAAFSGFSQIW